MAIVLEDGSLERALSVINEILAQPDSPDIWKGLELGQWAAIKVHIPEHALDSEITPPYMEAFLELQRQLYQLTALVVTGAADVRLLSEADRLAHQISVKVTPGTANYYADLRDQLGRLLKQMVGKMNGRQAATVILGIATLIGGYSAWSTYLETQKTLGIEELKSKEHIEALQALRFATEMQTAQVEAIKSLVEEQGHVGRRAVEAVAEINAALLKAASRTPKSEVNGQLITREEAQLLRTSPKKKPEVRLVQQRMRVVDINTDDISDLQIILKDPDTGDEFRMRFKDNLFAGPDRDKLFEALKTRAPLWVELAIKEVEGEIRSVQLMRCVEPPAELTTLETEQ